jgi:hypothetical protein
LQNLIFFQEIHYGPVTNDPVCGRSLISNRRVVGGKAAGFGVFPWQALVLLNLPQQNL